MPVHVERSSSGNHSLRPAVRPDGSRSFSQVHQIPTYGQLFAWTFGRASIIRRIWPRVLFHSMLTTVVVALTLLTPFHLAIPNVMMTVIGVVIGFVLSYRAMKGYDRYWDGRVAWGDLMKHSRAMARLIWLHVPLRISCTADGEPHIEAEASSVMREKKLALDLLAGYAVALKHHLRGEPDIYYLDLYRLITPLHEPRRTLSETALDFDTQDEIIPKSPLRPSIRPPVASTFAPHVWRNKKYRPRLAVEGRNLPLEILRCMSEWFSVLDHRGTVPGSSYNTMLGLISSLEDTLTVTEKILTTPMPVGYNSHIKMTVSIYLALLPFQLVDQFKWYTILGVPIASFIYLGFVAAGEQLEQPFHYDPNDLDLDLFCRDVIQADIRQIQKARGRHVHHSTREKETSIFGKQTLSDIVDGVESDSQSEYSSSST